MPESYEDSLKTAPSWCQVHAEKIKRMEHSLYGNGREGIVDKLSRIETLLKAALVFCVPIGITAGGIVVKFIAEHLGLL